MSYYIFNDSKLMELNKKSQKTTKYDTLQTFVFDENQKPEWKSLKTKEEFCNEFLQSSADTYARESNQKLHLQTQLETGVLISPDLKVENFYYNFPSTNSGGKPITTYHDGYLNYLLTAWRNDCGIEVGPWHIWNIILHQLCKTVKDDPQKYRNVFTTSSEKIEIIFNDGAMFEIDKFIEELRKYVPLNIDTFVPEFPGQPLLYRESMYGLFADMVQDFYSCGILSCSIPKIRLIGSDEDWMKLLDTVKDVNKFFDAKKVKVEYLTNATKKVFEMMTHLHDSNYWKDFFSVIRCGSGGEQEIKGHVVNLLIPRPIFKTSELPNMISRYPFKYYPAGSKKSDMNFVSGIFYSTVDEDGFLVPEYYTNILWKNMDRCKCSNVDINDIQVQLEFVKRMDKYDDYYYGPSRKHVQQKRMYMENSLSYSHSNELTTLSQISPPTFESYVEEAMKYSERRKKDVLPKLKKSYSKYVKLIKLHNEICRKVYKAHSNENVISTLKTFINSQNRSSGEEQLHPYQQEYLDEWNKHREDSLREAKTKSDGKYCFWLRDHLTYKTEGGSTCIHTFEFPTIDTNEYVNVLKLQQSDVDFIKANFNVIFSYISNNFEYFQRLICMYNSEIWGMLLNEFGKKPFYYDWTRGAYCWSDPRLPRDEVKKVYDNIRKHLPYEMTPELAQELSINLVFYILTHFSKETQFDFHVREYVVSGFLESIKISFPEIIKQISERYEYWTKDSITSVIETYMKSIGTDSETYRHPEKEFNDRFSSTKVATKFWNEFAKMTGYPKENVQFLSDNLVDQISEQHGCSYRVSRN